GHDPNNNNGWIEEDDEEEEEAKEEDEEEIEAKEEEDMEFEDDDAKITHPYLVVNPLNRPPPSPVIAEQEFMNAPVGQSTLQPLPPIRQFFGSFYVGKGSFATVFNPALSKVYRLGPMINDPGILYARVKTLTKQMWDRFRVESSSFKRLEKNDMRMDSFDDDLTALDSTLREQVQEMKKLKAAEEKAEYKHMEAEYYKNHFARVSGYYNDLRGYDYRVRNQLHLKRRYRERPYDPSTNTTSRPQHDDPYVMVRDNVVCTDVASDRGGEGVNTNAVVKDVREEKGDKGSLEVGRRIELKLRDTNIATYTERFNELALLCPDVVPNEKKKVELYIKGLPEYNQRRQDGARAMTATQNNVIDQGGPALKCNRCGLYHFGDCLARYTKCNKRGHKTKDYRARGVATRVNALPIRACYDCGVRNHDRSRCPKQFVCVKILKDTTRGHGNPTGYEYRLPPIDGWSKREDNSNDGIHVASMQEPIEIMNREVKQLKQSRIPIVKVYWNSRRGPEYTWEREDFFKNKYPHLFSNKKKTSMRNRAPGWRSRKEWRM
nr:putative reverse transcriptase domain-containing protein [Tanacetum cinerariifolium]